MVGIVELALRHPYTFVVMALLIMIFGVAAALRTPTDIFPNIDEMAGRIVTSSSMQPGALLH